MRWRRLGLLLEPPRLAEWAVSHASVPLVRRKQEALELMFSPRDRLGRSHTARAGLDLSGGRAEVRLDEQPLLSPGALGTFDDSGAMAACWVAHADREYLYYIGWSRGFVVPFTTSIGCAVSTDGGRSFDRVSEAPLVGRSAQDPLFATSPWVLVEDGRWRMWYASGVRWTPTAAGPRPEYRIVYAESGDGIAWRPTGRVCIDFASPGEYAIARPCVVRDADRYRMWFSSRGSAYRIGYAESEDGLAWERRPEGGLDAAGEGWESSSVEYPCVFDHRGERWLLYNGDGYGATGIGLAVLDRS